jgi:excisionase family DNA binding protein
VAAQDGSVDPQAAGAPPARLPDMPRFLTLADVAQTLNISAAQAYALVRNGELPAIKVGGRGQWRIETTELEAFIARMYEDTRAFVAAHPFTADAPVPADER